MKTNTPNFRYCISISKAIIFLLIAELAKTETPTETPAVQNQVPPQAMLAPPPVPGMPLPPGFLPFPQGFPMPGMPPPGMLPPFGMGIPPPGMPPGFVPPIPENLSQPPIFEQSIRPDGVHLEKLPDGSPKVKEGEFVPNQGQLPGWGEPGSRFPRPNGPDPAFEGPRPGFDGPRHAFDGPRHGFDGPRHGFDGPRHGFDGPRHGFDGHRPRFDGPRPDFDGPRPGFRGPPPWAQQRPRFPNNRRGSDAGSDGPTNEKREQPPGGLEPDQEPPASSWKTEMFSRKNDDAMKGEAHGKDGESSEGGEGTGRDREERDRGRDRGRPWDRDRDRDRGGRGRLHC